VLVGILVAACLGLGGWALLRGGTGCRFVAEGSCQRVLFIGNSYTSVNDLPAVYAALVRSGGGAVETAMIAPGGAFLADHAASPEVAAAIAGTPWTDVVLQEQSQAPASPEARERGTIPAALTLVSGALQGRARPWLLETWAHRDGWPEMGMDEASMQAALAQGYAEVGARVGAPVVPAGDAWQRALVEAPSIALWQPDGSHPTPAGTYLAACALYRALTGRSPVGLAETGGLPAEDAAALQRIAGGG